MSEHTVSIIMYHYVRDLKNSRYPGIKGLDLRLFRQQIEFLKQNFNCISSEQLLEASASKTSLPERAALLTFDDGYIDHYTNVFPILEENGIKGFFSMPAKIIQEQTVLDVNKIHYILASGSIGDLLGALYKKLDFYRGKEFDFPSNSELYDALAKANRFDDADTIFIKRVLQAELSERVRNRITQELFSEFVCADEAAFASELYMSYDQIKLMKRAGMHFGFHGYEHYWFERLSEEQYVQEIRQAREVFFDVIDWDNWIFCYPYGSYSESLIRYCASMGCKAGFTTVARTADLIKDHPLCLPRFDTNDFPPKSDRYRDFISA